MRSADEIRREIDRLASDERLGYSPATVFENAPLALEQLAIETKIQMLEWVLDLPPGQRKRLRSVVGDRT